MTAGRGWITGSRSLCIVDAISYSRRRIIIRRDYNYAAGRAGSGMDRAFTDVVDAALHWNNYCARGDCAKP